MYVFLGFYSYFNTQFDLPVTSGPILRKMNLILALGSIYFLEVQNYIDLPSFVITCYWRES